MEIIPAILPKDFRDLEDKVEQIMGVVPMVQVDICDGRFVSSFTWPYRKHDENFEKILKEERGMPRWEDVEYEIDLMVKDPEKEIMNWVTAGVSRVIIHLASTEHFDEIVKMVGGLVEIGVAVRVGNEMNALVEKIKQNIETITVIQCMGIERIGFQGQALDPRVIDMLRELRVRFPAEEYPHLKIGVDGGVTLENAGELKDAGADRLVVGSAIFATDNVVGAIHNFENI